MKRLSRFVLAPLGVLGALVALGATPAAAQETNPAETNVFELEAKTVYCQSGATQCALSPSTISDARFVDVSVFRFSPVRKNAKEDDQSGRFQKVSGKPELVHAVCATHYLGADNHVHAKAIDVTVGTITAPGVTPGTIKGEAAVVNGSEQSRFAFGSMEIEASAANNTRAEIEGFQVTDNTSDTRRFGGFRVTLEGTVADIDTSNPAAPPTILGHGKMSCRSNVNPAPTTSGPLANFAAPPDFTNEVNDTGDPSDPS